MKTNKQTQPTENQTFLSLRETQICRGSEHPSVSAVPWVPRFNLSHIPRRKALENIVRAASQSFSPSVISPVSLSTGEGR